MLTIAVAALSVGAVSIRYDQFAGLTIDVSGARLVAGSAFQYYEPGWKAGIYSSRWQPKSVSREANKVTVRFQDKAGDVTGTIMYTVVGDEVVAHYDFGWNGDRDVRIENCFGLLWASAFKDAVAISPEARRSRFGDVPFADQSILTRALALDTRSLEFQAPFGRLAIQSPQRFTVYDGRNLNQDWARGRPVHWAGVLEHPIKPGSRVAYTVTWSFSQLLDRPAMTQRVSGLQARLERAQFARPPQPLIPAPPSIAYRQGKLRTSGRFEPTQNGGVARLNSAVAAKWRVEEGPATTVRIENGPSTSVAIGEDGVTVVAPSEASVQVALMRVAQLLQSDDEGLFLPFVEIARDDPRLEWRGVHLFAGPDSRSYHERLVERLLLPLGFNNVVLQCERTAWESLKGTETELTTTKQDLAAIFALYRDAGIEPIPLIQSLGHMEYFFANGQNLSLAINPAQPYTLDVRKIEARTAIERVWDEAIALLRPRAVHFGLDEIDSRGMNDPFLATRLWNIQLPFLVHLAQRHGVVPMLWADMMLAPEEANGVAHAPNKSVAEERRKMLPKEAVVVDWQYANEPDPGKYRSLGVWKKLGVRAIAAGAHRPDNIAGLALAADYGYLQTTWSGYVSNDLVAARDLAHVAGYVLAAEYAWGAGRQAPRYDPKEVARQLLFEGRQPPRPLDGYSLLANAGPEYAIGQYKFRGRNLLELRSIVSSDSAAGPTGHTVSVNRAARRIALAVDCFAWMEYGDSVAVVKIHFQDGRTVTKTLLYGFDLRASDDPNPTATARANGVSCVELEVGDAPVQVADIELQRAHSAAGLRVHGITLI